MVGKERCMTASALLPQALRTSTVCVKDQDRRKYRGPINIKSTNKNMMYERSRRVEFVDSFDASSGLGQARHLLVSFRHKNIFIRKLLTP